MMRLLLLSITPLFLFAKVHYAKLEPYESVTLKSAVSALVLDVDLEAEGSVVDQKRVIYLAAAGWTLFSYVVFYRLLHIQLPLGYFEYFF